LKFKAYKLTLVQALTENDKQLRTVFSVNMLEFLENDDFGDRIVFSDEATFHINGRVNRHNVRIWGSEHPRQIIEHVRDSPKLNVFAAIYIHAMYIEARIQIINLLKNLKWPGGYRSAAPFNRQIEIASPESMGTIHSFSNNFAEDSTTELLKL
jgi:hypothetical protein